MRKCICIYCLLDLLSESLEIGKAEEPNSTWSDKDFHETIKPNESMVINLNCEKSSEQKKSKSIMVTHSFSTVEYRSYLRISFLLK